MKITKKLLKEMVEEELAAIEAPRRAWYEENVMVQRYRDRMKNREPKDIAIALHKTMNGVKVRQDDPNVHMAWGLILALGDRLKAAPEPLDGPEDVTSPT